MSKRHPICAVTELPPGQRQVVRIGHGDEVLVLNVEGAIYAINNICPHASAALERGEVIDGVLYCPLHRWGFKLVSGISLDDDSLCAQTYAVEICDGSLWLHLP